MELKFTRRRVIIVLNVGLQSWKQGHINDITFDIHFLLPGTRQHRVAKVKNNYSDLPGGHKHRVATVQNFKKLAHFCYPAHFSLYLPGFRENRVVKVNILHFDNPAVRFHPDYPTLTCARTFSFFLFL